MDLTDLKKIWVRFVADGTLDRRMQPIVAKSWQKCRDSGLDPFAGEGKRVDGHVFKSIWGANKDLLNIAVPIMQSVYDIVKGSHFLLVLTDSKGCILKTIGDSSIQEKSEGLGFLEGTLWGDLEVGSNAIGIALDDDMAVQIKGAEHYCVSHHNWTCSAAPIHGLTGEVIGCMDLSGNAEATHPHTLAVVIAVAFSIESMMASLHSSLLMRTTLNGSHESIVLLNDRFHPIWMNQAAESTLPLPLPRMTELDFRQLMPDVDWEQILLRDQSAPFLANDVRFLGENGTLRCSVAISPTRDSSGRTFTVTLRKQEQVIQSVNKVSGNQATYTFDSIYARDLLMKKAIVLAQKYAQYDGGILIEGESGTGKELFAQAIHNGSRRSEGPFVAVNCASLPRDLIESELFGYEKGAFTGALKEGNPGKFELADHGTLFLDEIGEMPLEFQAKLLRAVETFRIRRLGGKDEKRLDVRVIAATNRKLQREVELGRFRDDLYFRLNVLKLTIPPLRERPKDIVFCAQQILGRFNRRYPDKKKEPSQGFLRALEQYNWPGNVRELQNIIERLFYTCNLEIISEEDLYNVMGDSQPVVIQEKGIFSADDREKMIFVLQDVGGNVEKAAEALGVSRATFYRMCKCYEIMPKVVRKRIKIVT